MNMFAPITCLTVHSSKDQESSIGKTEFHQGEVTSDTAVPDPQEVFSDTSGPAHGKVFPQTVD